jgi:hypothetical protein
MFESPGVNLLRYVEMIIQELFPRPWAILRPAGGANASAAAAEAAAHHDQKHRSGTGCDAQLVFLETWR